MDEDSFLRVSQTKEGTFFRRLVDEYGHHKGVYDPSKAGATNRQGIYCFAPSGKFLGSVYSHIPEIIIPAVEKALENWDAMPELERLASKPFDPKEATPRPERGYPDDGLVLMLTTRDLPRSPAYKGYEDAYKGWWNRDFAWFKKEEARQFLPKEVVVGSSHKLPESLMHRLSRYHFLDLVRGADYPYRPEHIKKAHLTSKVLSVKNGEAKIRLGGYSKTEHSATWDEVNGMLNYDAPNEKRGVEVNIIGFATYNLKEERFTSFDIIALGQRWGGTSWNGRYKLETAPTPIGFQFRLAPDNRIFRVAPYALSAGENYWGQ